MRINKRRLLIFSIIKIIWHILLLWNRLQRQRHLKNICRVTFNEITQRSVKKAFESPHELDSNKFNAQQTRRILDRLVGYLISPILWDKVQRGLSAGRVQSVAVRLIVEREREVEAFKPQEFWSITAFFKKAGHEFMAKLFKINVNKAEIANEEESTKILESLKKGSYK